MKERFSSKKGALIAALQAGAARNFAILKAARRLKPDKSGKKPYKPGTLGTSAVTKAIQERYHGEILSRSERRQMSRSQIFYNGNGPLRVKHNIKPSKYKNKGQTSLKQKLKSRIRSLFTPKEVVSVAD